MRVFSQTSSAFECARMRRARSTWFNSDARQPVGCSCLRTSSSSIEGRTSTKADKIRALSGGLQPHGDRQALGHPYQHARRNVLAQCGFMETQLSRPLPGDQEVATGRTRCRNAGANDDWAGRSGGDPGGLRKALEVKEGDYIVMHMDGEELRVVNDEKEFAQRAREVLAGVRARRAVGSLVDELIADRRREAGG